MLIIFICISFFCHLVVTAYFQIDDEYIPTNDNNQIMNTEFVNNNNNTNNSNEITPRVGCVEVERFVSRHTEQLFRIFKTIDAKQITNENQKPVIEQIQQQINKIGGSIHKDFDPNFQNKFYDITEIIHTLLNNFETLIAILDSNAWIIEDFEFLNNEQKQKIVHIQKTANEEMNTLKQNMATFGKMNCGTIINVALDKLVRKNIYSYVDELQHYPQYKINDTFYRWLGRLFLWANDFTEIPEPRPCKPIPKETTMEYIQSFFVYTSEYDLRKKYFDNGFSDHEQVEIMNEYINLYKLDQILGDSRFFYLFSHKLITKNGYISPIITSLSFDEYRDIVQNDHPIFVDALIKTIEDGYLQPEFPPIFANSSDKIYNKYIKHKLYNILTNRRSSLNHDCRFFLYSNKNVNLIKDVISFCDSEKRFENKKYFVKFLYYQGNELGLEYAKQFSNQDLDKYNINFGFDSCDLKPLILEWARRLQIDLSEVDNKIQLVNSTIDPGNIIPEEIVNNNIRLLMSIDERKEVTDTLLKYPSLITKQFFMNNKSQAVINLLNGNNIQFLPEYLLLYISFVISNNPYATEKLNIEQDYTERIQQSTNEYDKFQYEMFEQYKQVFCKYQEKTKPNFVIL
jgi:hypothetical protein